MTSAIAFIPARASSVGLPNKNLRTVGGKTLVEHAIDHAKGAGCFNRIVVSSDSEQILAVAVKCGVEALKRPESLSGGDVEAQSVACHVLASLRSRGEEFDELCMLNPTSPLRTSADILATRAAMQRTQRCNAACSVVEATPIQMVYVRAGKREALHVKNPGPNLRQRRPVQHFQNGAVYWVKVPFLLEAHSLVAPRTAVHVMPKERSVDIDTYWDLLTAEAWYSEHRKLSGATA